MIKLWNETLETGMPAIDEQHKELFRQVEILFESDNVDRVTKTLDFLAKYVEKHFNDEQQLHQKTQYPKAELHKKMHLEFTNTYKTLKQDYDSSGAKLQVMLKINKIASEWLRNHIMVHDKEFAAYYKTQKN